MRLTPLVSIVLPTYNGARYLRAAIQSCLEQTYPHWELILVDDASTDETPAIIDEYVRSDARIRALRHEHNRKLPAALNTGFAVARGAYLTWTSDDNRYRPHALATLVAFLEERPDIDVVYADYTVIDEAGRPLRAVRVETPDVLPFRNPIGACFLYRAAVAQKVGAYAEDLFRAEDYDFWLRAAVVCTLAPLHEDLYEYRLHGASLNMSQSPQCHVASARAQLRNLPHMDWLDDATRAQAYLLAGLWLQHLDEPQEAAHAFFQAFVSYRIWSHDPDFVLKHILYSPTGLKSEQVMRTLLDNFPNSTNTKMMKRIKRYIWGHYYGIRCFDSAQCAKATEVRSFWLHAVAYRPAWLINLGFLRLVAWAYGLMPLTLHQCNDQP